jgi:NADH:ubiquinone reductase (H+-translocating)
MSAKKHVIVIGAGFGGLNCVRALADRNDILVTLMDEQNHHLFLPLLYQVAIAGLEAPQVAEPARGILRHVPNARFSLGKVRKVDLDARIVTSEERRLRYDYLVVATGSDTADYGTPGVSEHAYGLKRLTEAMAIRDQILSACEEASRTRDPERRKALLTTIIVGGGSTGVELAGALAELRNHALPKDFPEIEADEFRVLMVESSPHPLASMDERLSLYTERTLVEDFGVEIVSDTRVTEVTPEGVHTDKRGFIPGYTVIWAAGVRGNVISGLPEPGRGGRLPTNAFLQLDGHPEVFVVGDVNGAEKNGDGEKFPQLAQLAIQQGKTAARNIEADVDGEPLTPFSYFDKGVLVTIGRARGVANVGGVKITGFPAWFAWLAIHLVQLVGFRNRVLVFISWLYSYITYDFAVRIMYRRRRFPGDSSAITSSPE